MTRLLVQKLDYTLTKIRLDHLDSVRFKVRVHFAFFSEHRLRLHQLTHIVRPENFEDCPVEIFRSFGTMHDNAVFLGI